jgi:hypothetical protein
MFPVALRCQFRAEERGARGCSSASLLAAQAAGIPAVMQTGGLSVAGDEFKREELEVERRRMRPHPFRLADMWPTVFK